MFNNCPVEGNVAFVIWPNMHSLKRGTGMVVVHRAGYVAKKNSRTFPKFSEYV